MRWGRWPPGIAHDINNALQKGFLPVRGIESEIREALTNLILNAVDAMPEGGTITIRTRLEEPHVILEVADEGIGMEEETKGERGTGLGLGMVYGVMQRHEGEIEIESELGEGTTTKLLFPIVERSDAKEGAISSEIEEPVEPLKILCIDDEPVVRELMQDMLESDGHRVEVADGGQAGIDAFRAAREGDEPFEVIITDLGMPYLGGREVIRVVKSEMPETPVILLTGWGGRIKDEADNLEGSEYVITKPPTVRAVRKALREVTVRLKE